MEVTLFKWLAALFLFIAALAGGLLPFFLKRKARERKLKKQQSKDHLQLDETSKDDGSYQPPQLSSGMDEGDNDRLQPPPRKVTQPHSPSRPSSRALPQPILHGDKDDTPMAPNGVSVSLNDKSSLSQSLLTTDPSSSPRSSSRRRVGSSSDRKKLLIQTHDSTDESTAVTVSPVLPVMNAENASSTHEERHEHDEHHHDHHHSHSHSHRKKRRWCAMDIDRFLSLGNMLGAGIFLGGGLLHLLPESSEMLLEQQEGWGGPDFVAEFPIAFLLCGLGFYTILCVEEVTVAITTKRKIKSEAKKRKKKLAEEAEKKKKKAAAAARQRALEEQEHLPEPSGMTRSATYSPSISPSLSPFTFTPDPGSPYLSDSATNELARNIVTGFMPRMALAPTFHEEPHSPHHHHHHHHSHHRRTRRRMDSEDVQLASTPRRRGLASKTKPSLPLPIPGTSSSSDDEYYTDEDEAGPIQAFLNTPSNSPSPFPSLAGPRSKRRARIRAAMARRRHSFGSRPLAAGADSDGAATPRSFGSDSEAAMGSEGAERGHNGTPTYNASSRALGNATFTRGDGRHPTPPQPIAGKKGFLSTPTVASSAVVASMRQPLLHQSHSVSPSPDAQISKSLSTSLGRSSRMDEDEEGQKKIAPVPIRVVRASSLSKEQDGVVMDDQDHDHEHSQTDVDTASGHGHVQGHGHGHGGDGHSHMDISVDTSYIVAYLLVLALSFHSIFEGIALGTQTELPTTISIFIAIMAHTPLAGFALGVSLVKARASPRMAISCLVLFSATTPAGTLLGLALTAFLQGGRLDTVSGSFQAFSAGTFLFVALEEIIPKELASSKDKKIKLTLCVFGFLLMALIKTFDSDGHDSD